jgi:hypothetical protein
MIDQTIGYILFVTGTGSLIIGLVIIFYPLAAGMICSYNPPCNFKDGWDCSRCEFKEARSKTNGWLETILELLSFGAIK